MDMKYVNLAVEYTQKLLALPSPTGCTRRATDGLMQMLTEMGYEPYRTHKGCVGCTLGGEGRPLALSAHVDTLGLVVSEIKGSGALRFSRLGGPSMAALETEGVRVLTRDGRMFRGTVQMANASVHVNANLQTQPRDEDHLEILLDELVFSKADVEKLGIMTGDVVFIDPRTEITESGFIKSRFLDDKLSVGILLGYAKYLKEENITPERALYVHVTSFEEVGHGGSASVPQGVTEAISVDMGCVGDGLECDERKVSICAKDSGGPYHYDVVTGLIAAAEKMGAPYAVDVYPFYGSDVEATLRAGYDIRHGLIGAGVYASHGYERSHVDGALATLKVLIGYIG